MRGKYLALTDKILPAFYAVYGTLDYGFLEKVYENAMLLCSSVSYSFSTLPYDD